MKRYAQIPNSLMKDRARVRFNVWRRRRPKWANCWVFVNDNPLDDLSEEEWAIIRASLGPPITLDGFWIRS